MWWGPVLYDAVAVSPVQPLLLPTAAATGAAAPVAAAAAIISLQPRCCCHHFAASDAAHPVTVQCAVCSTLETLCRVNACCCTACSAAVVEHFLCIVHKSCVCLVHHSYLVREAPSVGAAGSTVRFSIFCWHDCLPPVHSMVDQAWPLLRHLVIMIG